MDLAFAEKQCRYRERQTVCRDPVDEITPDPPKNLAEKHGCYREQTVTATA